MVRTMNIDDYDEVSRLWHKIKGFSIRSIDDSREGVERFLQRNPETSVVAVEDSKIVGAILCGHDGRRGCMYHVCVDPEYRMRGIGKSMVVFAMNALKRRISARYPSLPLPRMMWEIPSGAASAGRSGRI